MDTNAQRHHVHAFFVDHPLGILSTVGADGIPETAAVFFVADQDMTCYFVGKEQSRKFGNITDRRHAALSVYDENALKFAEVKGEAEPVQSTDEMISKVTVLQETISTRKAEYWIPPVSQLQAGKYVVFRLVPKEVTFYSYTTDNTAEITEPQQIVLTADDLRA